MSEAINPKQSVGNRGRVNLENMRSDRSGLAGLFETFFRRFSDFTHGLLMLPVYVFGSGILGAALAPAVWAFVEIRRAAEGLPEGIQYFVLGFALALGFVIYGLSLLFIAPLMNWILRLQLKPWRGPYYSLPAIRWYFHNGLTYLMRFTFLEFLTPSPLNVLFLQLMGMRIGRGTIINTSYISDPSLIEMGKKVTIGGSVTLLAHYGQGGFLVLSPVKIGDGVTLGLRATVMGGVEIGAGAKILPHSVVLPKTKISAGETWGGVPARKIETQELMADLRRSDA
jgi:hypothetical protein